MTFHVTNRKTILTKKLSIHQQIAPCATRVTVRTTATRMTARPLTRASTSTRIPIAPSTVDVPAPRTLDAWDRISVLNLRNLLKMH